MSNINGIDRGQRVSIEQLLLARASSTGAPPSGPPNGKAGMSSKLDELLSSSGLDESQQESLKSDLQAAMTSTFELGTFPPDPSAMKSAMSSVFEKYGLDGDAMAQELAPPPPPDMSAMSLDATGSDSLTKLIEALQQSLNASGSSQTNTGTTDQSEELSQLLWSALSGIDGYA
jgi:hypothetical protein